MPTLRKLNSMGRRSLLSEVKWYFEEEDGENFDEFTTRRLRRLLAELPGYLDRGGDTRPLVFNQKGKLIVKPDEDFSGWDVLDLEALISLERDQKAAASFAKRLAQMVAESVKNTLEEENEQAEEPEQESEPAPDPRTSLG